MARKPLQKKKRKKQQHFLQSIAENAIYCPLWQCEHAHHTQFFMNEKLFVVTVPFLQPNFTQCWNARKHFFDFKFHFDLRKLDGAKFNSQYDHLNANKCKRRKKKEFATQKAHKLRSFFFLFFLTYTLLMNHWAFHGRKKASQLRRKIFSMWPCAKCFPYCCCCQKKN